MTTMVYSQSGKITITFKVITPDIHSGDSVFIAGNNDKLGGWVPDKVRLEKINDTTWIKSFKFPVNETIEYKFTNGSWDKEALTNDGKVPNNSVLKISDDTTVSIVIRKWKDELPSDQRPKFKGQITGTVIYLRKLKGKGIKPRDVIVWLPPSYNTDTSERYPVLYMQDGQNIFDPRTSSFGVDWQLDEVADSLIKAGVIKPIIIVGIYNTKDRSKEYTNTKLGHAYMNFVIKILKPLIDKEFRTLPNRKNTAVGGSSAGGLISFMLLWEYPGVFSQAACLSTAFHIKNINYIPNVARYHGKKKNIKIYIDIGTKDLEKRLKPGVDEMVEALKEKGYLLGNDLEYYIAKGADHSEADWAKRDWRFLEFMFKNK